MRTEMQTIRRLKAHFDDTELEAISVADAEDFVTDLLDSELAETTVARHVIRCRTIFNDAVRRRVIEENVWKEIEVGSQVGQITILEPELLDKLVDGMPDTEWKCLIAIYRYLGCRRGEALLLKWSDIDRENGRITITSPKTEHNRGKGSRVVPMFPVLRPNLDALWDETPDGTIYLFNEVVSDADRSGEDVRNIGAAFRHRAKCIGIDITWKPIQAFRQTRENELIREGHAAHLVHAWIGHDAVTAAKHYLDVTGADFDRAAGIVREATAAEPEDFGLSFGTDPLGTKKNGVALTPELALKQLKTLLIPRAAKAFRENLGVTGFEPVTSSCCDQKAYGELVFCTNQSGVNSGEDAVFFDGGGI